MIRAIFPRLMIALATGCSGASMVPDAHDEGAMPRAEDAAADTRAPVPDASSDVLVHDAARSDVPAADGASTACAVAGDGRTTLAFVNHCARPVQFAGSLITGGTLAVGETACRDVGSDFESLPARRYWGFDTEDPGNEHRTLAEFTFNTDFHDFDWYDISHVDADNLPMQIAPLARPTCRVRTCATDLVPGCPEAGRYEDAHGVRIACVSPDRNNRDSPVAQYFDQGCTDAYAWSGDDSATTACAGEDFAVVFCPTP